MPSGIAIHRSWGCASRRAVLEAVLVGAGAFATAVAAREGAVALWTPVVLGFVAGARAPGDHSARVEAGLAAWLLFALAYLHVVTAFFVLGGEGPHLVREGFLAAIVILPFGLVASGLAALVGGVVVAALADAPGDATVSLGETPSVHEVPLLRLAGSVVAGTLAAGVLTLFSGGFVAFLAPLGGGVAAGILAPEGSAMGALSGLCTGLAWAILLLAWLRASIASAEYVGPGVGFVIVAVVVYGLVAVWLGGIGGWIGAQG